MKFRKKPVVIDAVQFDGTFGSVEALQIPSCSQNLGLKTLEIDTLEGVMTAQPGDWIIRGVKGEFYPCKPEIFTMTYEPEMAEVETKTYPDGTQATGTAPLPDASPVSNLSAAVTTVCEVLRNDPDYAWGWHCNIAMAAIDSGCPRDVAQEAAALFLQILAQVDMRKHPHFDDAKATTSNDHLEAAARHITAANSLTADTSQ